MFEVGWSEILVIAIVALIVFPTKDLPRLMRTVGQVMGKARRMAGEFQSQFNTVLREAEKEMEESEGKSGPMSLNPIADLRKTLDPIRAIGDDIKRQVMTPEPPRPATPSPAAPSPAVEEAAPMPVEPTVEPSPAAPETSVPAPKATEGTVPAAEAGAPAPSAPLPGNSSEPRS